MNELEKNSESAFKIEQYSYRSLRVLKWASRWEWSKNCFKHGSRSVGEPFLDQSGPVISMLDIFAQSIPAQNTIEKTVPGERIHWLTLRWSRARSSVSAGALLPGGGNADVGVHDRPAAAADGAAVAAALVRAEQRGRARQPPLQPHPAAAAATGPPSEGGSQCAKWR